MQLPLINPTLINIGPFAIRWYSLAYIFGIVLAWFLIKYFNRKEKVFEEKNFSDDFFMYSVISIILGGRIGYVLFYNFNYYSSHILEVFKVWNGGMSFHGGFIGAIIGIYFLCKKYKISYFALSDIIAISTPIGLFLGRLANFINLELYGRITTSKFGIVFPNAGSLPRYPSQLFEAFLEGIILFLLLFLLGNFTNIRKHKGCLSGIFVTGYGISRFIVEFFREPDMQIGYILNYFTMGQLLSTPLIILGLIIILFSLKGNSINK